MSAGNEERAWHSSCVHYDLLRLVRNDLVCLRCVARATHCVLLGFLRMTETGLNLFGTSYGVKFRG